MGGRRTINVSYNLSRLLAWCATFEGCEACQHHPTPIALQFHIRQYQTHAMHDLDIVFWMLDICCFEFSIAGYIFEQGRANIILPVWCFGFLPQRM